MKAFRFNHYPVSEVKIFGEEEGKNLGLTKHLPKELRNLMCDLTERWSIPVKNNISLVMSSRFS